MSVRRLDPHQFDWWRERGGAAEVRRIADLSAAHDNRDPLNEAALLTLQNHGLDGGDLFLSGSDGFAYVHGLSGAGRPEIDLVVTPSSRGRGIGTELLDASLDLLGAIPVTAWSHGNHPAAARLAATSGFRAVRE